MKSMMTFLALGSPMGGLGDMGPASLARRSVIATDPMEASITLEELKGRPQGKKEDTHRSCLHDDITVVILHFQTDLARQVASKVTLFSTDPHQIFKEIEYNSETFSICALSGSLTPKSITISA